MIVKTGKVRLCTLCNCLTNIHLFASLTEQLPSSASFSHFTFLLCFRTMFYILALFQDNYFAFLLCFRTIILRPCHVSGQFFCILAMFWDNSFSGQLFYTLAMFQDNFTFFLCFGTIILNSRYVSGQFSSCMTMPRYLPVRRGATTIVAEAKEGNSS